MSCIRVRRWFRHSTLTSESDSFYWGFERTLLSVALEGVRDDFRYRDHVTSEVVSSFVVCECDDEAQTDRRNPRACMDVGRGYARGRGTPISSTTSSSDRHSLADTARSRVGRLLRAVTLSMYGRGLIRKL